jgi:hypothetical protein
VQVLVQPLREVVLLKAHFGEGKLFGVEGRASASLACVHVCVFVIMCVCAHVYTHVQCMSAYIACMLVRMRMCLGLCIHARS